MTPIVFSRRIVSLNVKPASIRSLVPWLSRKMQFPWLPLPSTQKRIIVVSPGSLSDLGDRHEEVEERD
ncbi:MAG: hypothetical protein V1736_02795 [Pseudomonadota bacterium]